MSVDPETTKLIAPEKAYAARLWGLGMRRRYIREIVGIGETTLARWSHEDDFQAIAAEIADRQVRSASTRMRSLAQKAVDALELGVTSTHRAVKGEGNTVMELPDHSLAVQTAKIITERIPELMPHKGVEVEGEMADRITDLIRGLDGGGADHGGAHRAPALPAPPVRPDQPVDPDQA